MLRSTKALKMLLRAFEGGVYTVGERMPPERDLAKALKVSRGSVRKALAALERDGMVYRHVGRGTFVNSLAPQPNSQSPSAARAGAASQGLAAHNPAPLSARRGNGLAGGAASALLADTLPLGGLVLDGGASPREIMEVRQVLEPAVAGLAALSATREEIDQIRSHMEHSETATDWRSYEHHDGLLHQAIAKATHNGLLAALLAQLNDLRKQEEWRTLRQTTLTLERRQASAMAHRRIVDAIARRDAAAASAAMRDHINGVAETLMALPSTTRVIDAFGVRFEAGLPASSDAALAPGPIAGSGTGELH